MPTQDTFELRQILSVLQRWAWLIVACVLLGGGVAYAVSKRTPPTYKASTSVLVLLPDDSRTSEYNTLVAGQSLALTYSQMLTQRPTLTAVIQQLGLSTTPEQLAKHIDVETIKDTQLIRVTVTDSSPDKAAQLANTVSQAFTTFVKNLQEERYRTDLQNSEANINTLQNSITETKARADAVSRQQIDHAVEKARLERLLPSYSDRYRALQDAYSSALVLTWRGAPGLKVANPAQLAGPGASGAYTATVFMTMADNSAGSANVTTTVTADGRLAANYAAMVTGKSLLGAAITALGLPDRPETLANNIKAEWLPDKNVIRLRITYGDGTAATQLADTIAGLLADQVQISQAAVPNERLAEIKTQLDQLDKTISDSQAKLDILTAAQLSEQRQLAQLDTALAEYRNDYRTAQQVYEQQKQSAARMAATLRISEPASVPAAPTQSTWLYVGLAALVGGALALALAFLYEYLDEAVKTPEDISEELNLTTLATVARLSRAERRSVITSSTQPSFEAFRVMAAKLLVSNAKSPLQSLLVTSPSADEGKSLVAANLAAAISQTGLRVALVDADLRNPGLHKLFALSPENGLTEAARQGTVDGNLHATRISGLSVLPTGALPGDPAGFISSPGMKQVLRELTSQADMVIIDSPPILSVAETALLAAEANGVLLVFRAGSTRSRAARQAVDTLGLAETRLVGAVLNEVPAGQAGYYDYHHHAPRKPHKLTFAFWRKS